MNIPTMNDSSVPANEMRCAVSHFPGVDVCISPCGCLVKAHCLPVSLLLAEEALLRHEKRPVGPGERPCPACRTPVTSLRILPMQIDELDRAVALRKQEAQEKLSKKAASSNGNSPDKLHFGESQAEASYLLLSHGGAAGSLTTENDYQRTGRWTDEEVAYTDFLVECFDSGKLPIEHGMKLSDFLSEVLLCKSSRLTKKMKNAKLSVRSYEYRYPLAPLDTQTLATLEAKFLASVTSEPSQLELSFNLTRLWRSHLSNLCVQIGSSLLDATDWMASLEFMEQRATQAEENIRKARRRRMGLALRKDVKSGKDGVFFSGVPVQRPGKQGSKRTLSMDNHSQSRSMNTDNSSAAHSENSDHDFIQDMLDLEVDQPQQVDDYARILDDLANGPGMESSIMGPKQLRNNCGPFLEAIISYAEANYLPFQHVDVWVPSYTSNNGEEELRLFHAGFATRTDLDSTTFGQMNEYGEYSTKFSFASGVGLPGRVFATAGVRWERGCHEADPKYFERAGGAKIYGVKTGFGFPLTTKVIGRIVLCFYSVEDVPEDPEMAAKCCAELSRLCPEPKWKLVVDMAPSAEAPVSSQKAASQAPLAHYHHASSPGRMDDASVTSGSTRQSQSIDEDLITDQRIATLLGDHMPLSDLPAPGESTNSAISPSLLVPHFMSLRLLLLRPADRRSPDENDTIDVIRQSFRGYTRDGRRGEKEIAHLIVKDWQYLRATAQTGHASKPSKVIKRNQSDVSQSSYHSQLLDMPPPPFGSISTDATYQSHVMDLPPPPQASDASPVTMPNPLGFIAPHMASGGSMQPRPF